MHSSMYVKYRTLHTRQGTWRAGAVTALRATIYLAPLLDVLRGRSTAQLGLPCAAQREARFFTLGGRTHTAWAGERCKMDSSSSSFL